MEIVVILLSEAKIPNTIRIVQHDFLSNMRSYGVENDTFTIPFGPRLIHFCILSKNIAIHVVIYRMNMLYLLLALWSSAVFDADVF